MKIFQTEVFCTLQIEGYHCWKACPFGEVSFLRNVHRHMFHIKAYKNVIHKDRDIEFIMLKRKIERYLHDTFSHHLINEDGIKTDSVVLDFGTMSCEQIASNLIDQFDLSKCEVSEDGENGCVLTATENIPTLI